MDYNLRNAIKVFSLFVVIFLDYVIKVAIVENYKFKVRNFPTFYLFGCLINLSNGFVVTDTDVYPLL